MGNKFYILVISVICGICLYNMRALQGFTDDKKLNDIALANINALAGGEDSPSDPEKEQEECWRIKSSASCYHIVTGKFCNVRITAVEKYTRISLVEVCDHYRITYCNGNCTEKKP